jgi:hypothetical protein
MHLPQLPSPKSESNLAPHPAVPVLEGLEPRMLLSGDILVTIDSLSTTDTTPQLTGTVGDDTAAVVVRVNGANYSATNNADGTWTLADDTIAPALDPGIYDVDVLATAGTSFGTDESTNELAITSEVPLVTVNDLTTNQLRPAITGTVDDPDASITVTVHGADYAALNNGNGTWTLQSNVIAILGEGTYDVSVAADNGDGHVGHDETTDELVIDRTDPAMTVDPLTAHVASPALSGTVVDVDTEATIVVAVNGHSYAAVNNGDGTWSLAAGTVAALTDGAYDVSVTATDAAGNIGTDETTNELEVVLPPSVTIAPLATQLRSPALSGTVSDDSATITVTVNGGTYDAVNGADGTWSLDAGIIADLPDGVYNVVGEATAGGLSGTDKTVNELTIDNVAPTVTVTSLSTSDHRPQLGGTVDEPDATVTVTVEGTDYTATNNGDGTWTLPDNTTDTLTSGPHDVLVSAEDPAGNEGSDPGTDALSVLPLVTVDSVATPDASPALSGSVDSTDATVTVTVDGGTYDAVNDGEGTWSLDAGIIADLAEGTYDVQVEATVDGVTGTDETLYELVVDMTAPTVTMDPVVDPGDSPALSGTVTEPTATVVVTVDGTDEYTATNNGDGTWTLPEGTIAPLSEDTHDVSVTATDAAGNTGSHETTITIHVPPVVTVDTLLTNDSTPTLTGTVSDAGQGDLVGLTVLVTVNGHEYAADVDTAAGTWTFDGDSITSPLADGTYNVSVTATDIGLAEGTDDTVDELTVDTVKPEVGMTDLTTSQTSPELTGSVDDPEADVVVNVNGTDYDATNNGDDTWSIARYVIPNLPAGTHDVTVTATDPAGNVSDPAGAELTITTTAPTVTIDPLTTTNRSPALTGTVGSPDAAVIIRVNGHNYDATNNGDGTWTLEAGTIPALSTTTYEVQAWAQDEYDNYGLDDTLGELTIIPQMTVYLTPVNRRLSFHDEDGTAVGISLRDHRGTSYVAVTLDADSQMNLLRTNAVTSVIRADSGVSIASISFLGDTFGITVVTTGGRIAGTAIGSISGSGDVGSLKAMSSTLTGSLNMTGYISSLSLASVRGDITMTGMAERAIRISVRNDVTESNIRIVNSSIATFSAGSMVNAALYCGVLGTPDVNTDGVWDLPTLANLRPDYRIGSVRVTGYRGAAGDLFVNSNIGCDWIGSVTLKEVMTDNTLFDGEGDPVNLGDFGVAANTIRSLSITHDRGSYSWRNGWPAGFDPENFVVRVV